MRDERLSDEQVAAYINGNAYMRWPEYVQSLAREVQEWRRHSCVDSFIIDALCARHDIDIDGIVRLVDDAFDEANDSLSDGWTWYQRRLARGES